MASRSFKRDLSGRPLRYRTPSPPRDAVELVSPVIDKSPSPPLERHGIQWTNNSSKSGTRRKSDAPISSGKSENHQRSYSQGTMDAFASIALATGARTAPYRPTHVAQAAICHDPALDNLASRVERLAERARSEKIPSPELSRSSAGKGARPATSYQQQMNSRILEAELLLNFAQEARFAVPYQRNYQHHDRTVSSKAASASDNSAGPLQDQGTGFRDLRALKHRSSDTRLDDNGGWNAQRTGIKSPTSLDNLESPECWRTSDVIPQQSRTITNTTESTPSNGIEEQAPVTETTIAAQPNNAEAKSPELQIGVSQSRTSNLLDLDPSSFAMENSNEEPQITRSPIVNAHAKGEGVSEIQQKSIQNLGQSQDNARTLELPGQMQTTDPRQGEQINQGDSEMSLAAMASSYCPSNENAEATSEGDTVQYEVLTSKSPEANTLSDAVAAVCAACHFSRSIADGEMENSSTSWISCDACKTWFHFACAGFKSEREVRGVDKYRCRKCRPSHGPTTFVRKSARAHSAIDYAGLHQGVLKTSDETPEHHYIKPIKEGTLSFLPETFARIRPELLNAEYFEQGHGWKEPLVVPAAWNPRPDATATEQTLGSSTGKTESGLNVSFEAQIPAGSAFADAEPEFVPDHGQDALDMVMPQGLTVKAVAELYGPEEKVEVIDVKSQNGESKKWNMRRWAEYYESKGNKIVRNVISLEVSQSRLGRLIRRPQIVRDLDLQDSVWPAELQAKGEIPRVQFYCLMSVADCFTDFHIDFGGSSVFYHILKGKKTFFFIPPKEKHLKKYEEWCLSPAQNWTFLGSQTKECYRVDLCEGDTMLIPAGWIHAVWTPEDSLVIGGNFLTRLNYGMQFRIAQIEKATGVARKFRYPHFQKIQWYTAFRYLEDDPLPEIVRKLLQEGEIFYREKPAHHEFDDWGENSKSGLGNYHARCYSQAELEGLPDLTRYLLRTALIDLGSITDGITQETRNAVKRSIPRGHGEPLEVVKRFAAWCAWKRGNETIPPWAYPDAVPEPESAGKMTAATQKKLDREAALQAPRRQSARMQSQQNALSAGTSAVDGQTLGLDNSAVNAVSTPDPTDSGASSGVLAKRKHSNSEATNNINSNHTVNKKRRTASGTGSNSLRKVACESCRKRRRACKHKDIKEVLYPESQPPNTLTDAVPLTSGASVDALLDLRTNARADSVEDIEELDVLRTEALARASLDMAALQQDVASSNGIQALDTEDANYLLKSPDEIASTPKMLTHLSGAGLMRLEHRIAGGPVNGLSVLSLNAPHSRGRTKACNDCRKSKRRCIHDEYGNEDPVKAAEAAIPRPAAANKRRKFDSEGNEVPSAKRSRKLSNNIPPDTGQEPSGIETPSRALAYSAQTPSTTGAPTAIMVPPPIGTEPKTPGKQDVMLDAFDQIQAAAEPLQNIDQGVMQTSETQAKEATTNLPVPVTEPGASLPEAESQNDLPQSSHESQDHIQNESLPTLPSKRDFPVDPILEHTSSSFSVPAASLVSPPASSNADAGRTPPSPSAASSRHSSHHPKQMHRYTPESGPRRDSSSSVDEPPPPVGNDAVSQVDEVIKDTSPMTTISTTGENERRDETRRRKSRSSIEDVADEESLRLIKELQAQDYGLRRRGKA